MTVRQCAQAYALISRVRSVSILPQEIEDLEEKTAGGIMKKLRVLFTSEFYKTLPATATIVSGANSSYFWDKKLQAQEASELLSSI